MLNAKQYKKYPDITQFDENVSNKKEETKLRSHWLSDNQEYSSNDQTNTTDISNTRTYKSTPHPTKNKVRLL